MLPRHLITALWHGPFIHTCLQCNEQRRWMSLRNFRSQAWTGSCLSEPPCFIAQESMCGHLLDYNVKLKKKKIRFQKSKYHGDCHQNPCLGDTSDVPNCCHLAHMSCGRAVTALRCADTSLSLVRTLPTHTATGYTFVGLAKWSCGRQYLVLIKLS